MFRISATRESLRRVTLFVTRVTVLVRYVTPWRDA
jgi:hypothetical protein